MDDREFIPGPPVFEYDQGFTKADLEMMAKYNKACEKLCLLGNQHQTAQVLHQTHVFLEALLTHLKNGKKPSFYEAWDILEQEIPQEWRKAVLEESGD